MADARSPLLELPAELTGMIGEHLPNGKDLLHLRLVNKDIAARTERSMLPANFSNLEILFSVRSSLRNAVNITSHPKFGAQVRSITIRRGKLSREPLDDATFPGGSELPSGDRQALEKHKKRRRRFFDLVEDQETMIRNGNDATYILNIFRNLASTRHQLCVEVCEMHEPELAHVFVHKVGAIPGYYDGVLARTWDDHRPLLATLKALRQVRTRLEKFIAGDEECAVPLHFFTANCDFDHGWNNLKNVTTLELAIELEPRTRRRNDQKQENLAFITFLHNLVLRLKKLKLCPIYRPYSEGGPHTDGGNMQQVNNVADLLCSSVFIPNLECFILSTVHVNYAQLARFLRSHARTLSECCISDVVFTGCEPDRTQDEWSQKFKADSGMGGLQGEGRLVDVWFVE